MNYTLTVEGRKPITGTLDAPVVPSVGPLLITNKLAIVSRLETLFLDPRPIEVNAIAFQDADIPVSPTKGHTIPVMQGWRDYLRKIQSPEAYRWVFAPYMLWINRTYVGDSLEDEPKDAVPMAECIGAGYGNYVEILRTVTSKGKVYHEIKASHYGMGTSQLDPAKFNWRTHPTMFGKCTARRKSDGSILNVGDGLDAYFPIIKRSPYLWICGDDVELLPPLPAGMTHYALEGASVYGWTGSEYIPLRIAERPGQLEHPHPGWRLNTPSVIPPVS